MKPKIIVMFFLITDITGSFNSSKHPRSIISQTTCYFKSLCEVPTYSPVCQRCCQIEDFQSTAVRKSTHLVNQTNCRVNRLSCSKPNIQDEAEGFLCYLSFRGVIPVISTSHTLNLILAWYNT